MSTCVSPASAVLHRIPDIENCLCKAERMLQGPEFVGQDTVCTREKLTIGKPGTRATSKASLVLGPFSPSLSFMLFFHFSLDSYFITLPRVLGALLLVLRKQSVTFTFINVESGDHLATSIPQALRSKSKIQKAAIEIKRKD